VSEQRPLPGGRLEYAVLVAVWDGGTITAREVHDRVGAPHGLGYTTTARVLDRLHAKGLVARERSGKVWSYRAVAPRAEIDRARLARTLAGVLGGDHRPAVATLVAAIDDIDPGLLDELTRAIDALRRSRREP
jgi:BlaI family transcriptional regulator, penicillinase repressor